MEQSASFRWLGANGVEVVAGDKVLLIDPFLSRPPLRSLLAGRPRPNRLLLASHLPRANLILVTHSHYDHLMDVPSVAARTGSLVAGSPHTCRIAAALGVPAAQLRQIRPGSDFSYGSFRVQTFPSEHMPLPSWLRLSDPLPAHLQPPFRLLSYRADCFFSFLVSLPGSTLPACPSTADPVPGQAAPADASANPDRARLLFNPSPAPDPAPPADVVFVMPGRSPAFYGQLLAEARPRLVVAVHWDDFFSPLSQQPRPLRSPTGQLWPPLAPIDLRDFARNIRRHSPGTDVLIPQPMRRYTL